MTVIRLPLLAKHFKRSNYRITGGCSVALAAKEWFNVLIVAETCTKLYVYDDMKTPTVYEHEPYTEEMFQDDLTYAKQLADDVIVRTIVLAKS